MCPPPSRDTLTGPSPGSVPFLRRPLDKVLGKRTADQLAKQGATTVAGLLRLLPRRYDTWGELTDLAALTEGEQATIQAEVVRSSSRRTRSGRPPAILEATVTDGSGLMDIVLFGAPGLMSAYAAQLAPGSTVLLSGKVGMRQGRRQLAGPRFQVLTDLDDAEREALLARPVPIYPATDALPSWRVAKAVRTVLDQLAPGDVPDPIPADLRESEDLIDALTAYRWVHMPQDPSQWKAARARLRHEEALVTQTALAQRRAEHAARRTAVAWPEPPPSGSLRASLDDSLPFALTEGQRRVGDELAAALASTIPMQRLLQGDVGSGKTLVALRAMTQVVGGGGQAALLAPTEVLAAQHRESLAALLGPLASAGTLESSLLTAPGQAPAPTTALHLLTGSTPAPERRRILAALAGGEPGIVVGTHALLSETVRMPLLGLVVVDEQHRFGVAQRDALRERPGVTDPATGQVRTPHLLVMTATPIPRTIAMTVFGDLTTSILDELPAGRSPVETFLVPWERRSWVEGLWRRAATEIAGGGRVYVVCPRIEADDDAATGEEAPVPGPGAGEDLLDGLAGGAGDGAPARPLAAVEDWAERLAAEPALGGVGVGALTGRMTPAEKDAAMRSFASGAAPVLVATTVIEVGVDVPEATMMVILDADRFGLSQLHQLRGRVGRGGRPSVCMAVTGAEVGSPAYHRLRAFASTLDGFALAEADLELRSEGNVLGAAQSGRRSDLDLLRVRRDAALIERARAQAEAIIAADPELAEHRALAAAIADRLDDEAQAYLERS
ncbi:ATP-dependent DNA helicase RecG [Actinomyces denticolens]|uniref:ATP-dependent DNA helicase RecG n=1 Tax=Actinomyces denticolens TaxID=52767 RepID=A0ABY1I9E8_9ACTO|nr:ATP-dependent DNA helicase RecG [Actinomyces denticolens]SUU03108.1 ATP-dependent DNA helicase recG [Actinomyces denticolens]